MYPVKALKDICYDPEHDLLLDLYLPEKEGPCPVFVFFHGGGFEDYRQKDMGEPLSRELAAQGILDQILGSAQTPAEKVEKIAEYVRNSATYDLKTPKALYLCWI